MSRRSKAGDRNDEIESAYAREVGIGNGTRIRAEERETEAFVSPKSAYENP